jgi:hypothetical protein
MQTKIIKHSRLTTILNFYLQISFLEIYRTKGLLIKMLRITTSEK